jgi:5-methylcytosine-specific restriction protein A
LDKLPFIPKQVYRRVELHKQFGGNPQSGIANCAKYPYIFIFSGSKGKQHGYKDRWENNNVYSYTGEGQLGDMEFTRGNLALRDHLNNGKRVFLFEYVKSGIVEFVSELQFLEADYFETFDRNGDLRTGIKFFFKRAGIDLNIDLESFNQFGKTNTIPDLFAPVVESTIEPYLFRKPTVTERSGLVNSRVGQGAYRKSILYRWEFKCAVTQFDDPRILIASHIVPWKDATDEQRLDVENGILLSPTYDALFDQHLITFDDQGKISLSNTIETSAYNKIGVTGNEQLKSISAGMIDYLSEHQTKFSSKFL